MPNGIEVDPYELSVTYGIWCHLEEEKSSPEFREKIGALVKACQTLYGNRQIPMVKNCRGFMEEATGENFLPLGYRG